MGELRTLLDDVIADQGQLTAVAAFSRAHDLGAINTPRYRVLMPLSLPKPGQQLAFEVDLDRCSGCKACVAACHSLNGLDDHESWREVGTLVSNDWRQPFQQTVPTTCHHCVDPACLNGCPVLAYEKDSVTGIVRHLDDQCIGCQYCVMMCPYEVPKYSEARGIVRKCDMCSQRLSAGEAPACVQACPSEAIRISIVEAGSLVIDFREASTQNSFLPSSPDPAITIPTTKFVSRAPLSPNLAASEVNALREQPAHWPLIWMLVLTQLGVGSVSAALISPTRATLVLALGATLLGLASSVAHLGQPLKAWRSFLGLRTSWLSREIIGFGIFSALLGLSAWRVWINPANVSTTLSLTVTALFGFAAVFCSAFVYRATRRVFWRGALVTFFLTSALLGTAGAWAATGSSAWPIFVLATLAALKLAMEMKTLRHGDDTVADDPSAPPGEFDRWSLAQTAVLLRGRFALVMRCRLACLVAGGLVLPLVGVLHYSRLVTITALALCFTGELIERYLFFRAVVPPRMPGGS